MKKHVYIKTYGCQMNVYDSQRMTDILAPLGYETTDSPEKADLILLNTCHIREKASEKVFSELGRLKLLQQSIKETENRDIMLGVAGCVAQAEGEEFLRRAPQVDLVVGPQSYHRLPELLAKKSEDRANTTHDQSGLNTRQSARRGVIDVEFPPESKFDALPEESLPRGTSAFLSIQEGCDKFCTFCVVPYTRGAEFSRPAAAILFEAQRLLDKGTREITLLGQNVNAYHGAGLDGKTWSLARLLYALAELPGLARLRYTTSHPRDMDADLIAAHGEIDALMPFLHLPVQSGSDRILGAMNRKHSAQDYLRIIEKLRAARPDIAFSSDFIVGFPGESDRDFAHTISLVTEVGFAQAYSFVYSPRPGTPASTAAQQVDSKVANERLQALQELIKAQQVAFNHAALGKSLPVLFEKTGRHPGQIIGRSPYMQAVVVQAPSRLINHIADVRLSEAHSNAIFGEVMQMDGGTQNFTRSTRKMEKISA